METVATPKPTTTQGLSKLLATEAQAIDAIDGMDFEPLLDRIGDARLVLIGEASHGTSEFYRLREQLTRELIRKQNFNFVAVEADWPDAAHIDNYVRHVDVSPSAWTAFSRFPTWMWRNREVRTFVDWLHDYNQRFEHPNDKVGFHGLDLYSLYTSIGAVLGYLESVDKETARLAQKRYDCLTPWEPNAASYGLSVATGRFAACREQVVSMLKDLLAKRLDYTPEDGERYIDAVHNARLIANAEHYYRSLYTVDEDSWNLRDSHMFETLQYLLDYRGAGSKAVVWAHNSHLGDARATDMGRWGQHNLGQLCRQFYVDGAYLIGFGTHQGTVAAASDWGGPMEVKQIRPALTDSWEAVAHATELPAFMLGLRNPNASALQAALGRQRLERAIGVIYSPESERVSHYFNARLSQQFDEYIWFDQTRAITPLDSAMLAGVPDTYPFGL